MTPETNAMITRLRSCIQGEVVTPRLADDLVILLRELDVDAELFRFLRDYDDKDKPDDEIGAMFEWLICKGCRGQEFTDTVRKIRDATP